MIKDLPETSKLPEQEKDQYMTPAAEIERVTKVLKSIDLDPMSSAHANRVVKAKRFHDREENGWTKPWYGNVFLNPPYSRHAIKTSIKKFLSEWKYGEIQRAILLVNTSSSAEWYQGLLEECHSICLRSKRIKFNHQNPEVETEHPRYDNTYFLFVRPTDYVTPANFKCHFQDIGRVLCPT